MNTKKQNVSGISKFLFTTLLAAAMTSSAWAAEVYVNCDYNSSTEGWGGTRFSDYASAYAYTSDNNKSATIVVEKTNTLSGNTFDNNHKNYNKLAVVVNDGATVGNALSKWDMAYAVTVKAGGSLEMARPSTASVSNVHIKNSLVIGEEGSAKKANLHFLSDSYQDGDISIRYNGSLTAYNADITVQDLDAQGKMSLTDSTVTVSGALSTAAFYKTTLTRTKMTVGGTQISGGLSDFAGKESNQLGNFTMSESELTFGKTASVKVAATVSVDKSYLSTGDLVINSSKKLNLTDSVLSATKITNNGTITVYGDSTINATSIVGNEVVVTSGATLTLSASSLLANVDNQGGTVLFEKIDSEVSLGKDSAPLTVGTSETGTVQLSTESENVVVSKAEQIATKDVEINVEGVVVEKVLAAWSFDIENNGEAVSVTMDVGTDVSLETIKIFHREDEDSAWEDYTEIVTDVGIVDGKLTFTTTSFSEYSVGEVAAAPEPSAFGLLAGLGALALVASRRRRRD